MGLDVQVSTTRPMVQPQSWEEFRAAGLLWWVNRGLHLFGWAIVVEVGEDDTVHNCYPARVRFRGFDTETEERGFQAMTESIGSELPNMRMDAAPKPPPRLD